MCRVKHPKDTSLAGCQEIEFDLFSLKETLMRGWIVAWPFQPQLPLVDLFTAPPVETSKPSESGPPSIYLH